MPTRKEILKLFLEDPILKQKYGLGKDQSDKIGLNRPSNNNMAELIKQSIIAIEGGSTPRVAVRNLNKYLEKILRS